MVISVIIDNLSSYVFVLKYLFMRVRSTSLPEARLHIPSISPSLYSLKWVLCSPKALFTYNVRKIKGAAYRKGEVDGTCKRDIIIDLYSAYHSPQFFTMSRLALKIFEKSKSINQN